MRAALYGRRSTDERQAESLEVQEGEGRRYIEGKGWSLRPEHVFMEDAVSRAEFKKRPALLAMLNSAQRGDFDVVVIRDETRLGGDTFRTGMVIQDLIDSGIRLFYYYTAEEIRLDGAVDKFMMAARNFAAELEREKIAQRTHEHLLVKARRGLNVGGRCYGYDNVEVEVDGRRVRVEYRINEEHAEVIREVFHCYAAGEGLRAIAKDLNARGIPFPKVGRRGSGSWSYSCIREMVRRQRYRGTIVWNRFQKTYRGGTKVRIERPACEWIRIDAPDLRIVNEELWQAVVERIEKNERSAGKRGRRGPTPGYMLSGLARCGECGGPLTVSNGRVGRVNVKVYGCAWHRNRGDSVCGNTLRRPVKTIDEAVVAWIRQNVLSEEVVLATLKEIRRRLRERAKTSDVDVARLESEAKTLTREIDTFTRALLSTDAKPEAIVTAIAEREGRLRSIKVRLEALQTAPSIVDLEVRRMEREARSRIDELNALLGRNPAGARKAMEALLDGPLIFTPIETSEGRRYRIEGPTAIGAMFTTGSVPSGIRTRVAGPKGRLTGLFRRFGRPLVALQRGTPPQFPALTLRCRADLSRAAPISQ